MSSRFLSSPESASPAGSTVQGERARSVCDPLPQRFTKGQGCSGDSTLPVRRLWAPPTDNSSLVLSDVSYAGWHETAWFRVGPWSWRGELVMPASAAVRLKDVAGPDVARGASARRPVLAAGGHAFPPERCTTREAVGERNRFEVGKGPTPPGRSGLHGVRSSSAPGVGIMRTGRSAAEHEWSGVPTGPWPLGAISLAWWRRCTALGSALWLCRSPTFPPGASGRLVARSGIVRSPW